MMKQSLQLQRFKKKSIFVAASLALFSSANALTFSTPEVLSKKGEPLNAKIQILTASEEEIDGLSALMGSPALYRMYNTEVPKASGDPIKINVQLVTEKEKRHIRITTPEAIESDRVDLILQLKWATGKLIKGFGLAVAPKGTKSTTELAQSQPSSSSNSLTSKPSIATAAKDSTTSSLTNSFTGTNGSDKGTLVTFDSKEIKPQPTQPQPFSSQPTTEIETSKVASTSIEKQNTKNVESTEQKPPSELVVQPAITQKLELRESIQPAQPFPANDLMTDHATVNTVYGETATSIARRNLHGGVTLNQMLVAMLRGNPNGFTTGDINRLKSDVTLIIPSIEESQKISSLDATRQMESLYKSQALQPTLSSQDQALTARQVDTAAVDLMNKIAKAAVSQASTQSTETAVSTATPETPAPSIAASEPAHPLAMVKEPTRQPSNWGRIALGTTGVVVAAISMWALTRRRKKVIPAKNFR